MSQRILFIYLIFLFRCAHSFALVCPKYFPDRQEQNHRFLRNCQSNCSFTFTSDLQSACLGVYYKHAGHIFIKQLGLIHSDEQCLTEQQCLLNADPVNSQVFSCCCSTDNCTLNWINVISTTTTSRSTFTSEILIVKQDYFSWQLFIVICLCVIGILCFFVIGKSFRTHQHDKHHESSLIKSSSIENLFFSAQQLVLGQNSIIYKAYRHEQLVALKVYQQTHVLVWTNELMLLKSIQHESIIKILSDGQYESHLYLVLPFYEHGTLQSYLRTPSRTLTLHQCLVFIRSLASAISYLHLARNSTGTTIVHRDIKSSNILVCNNGTNVCLADFGVAVALPCVLTEKDFVQIGTIRYMAPELLEGVIAHTREALCSVDIYAFALVMWEIMSQCDLYSNTGYRAPYDEYLTNGSTQCSFAVQIYDIVVARCLRPSLVRPLKDAQHAAIIQELCTIIDACWIADPDLRMNAQALAFKLNQFNV